jgi:hypothetical protein
VGGTIDFAARVPLSPLVVAVLGTGTIVNYCGCVGSGIGCGIGIRRELVNTVTHELVHAGDVTDEYGDEDTGNMKDLQSLNHWTNCWCNENEN